MVMSRWTVCGLLLLALVGCSPDDGTSEPSISYETGPFERDSPSPSPEASPSSTLTPDQQAAVEVVDQYFDLENQVRMDPEMDPTPLFELLTGKQKTVVTNRIGYIRQEGWLQIGSAEWSVNSVDPPEGEEIQVHACTDSADGRVVHQDTGEQVGDPAGFMEWEMTLQKVNDSWKVSYVTNREANRCATS